MAFCTKCGGRIAGDMRFCASCGAPAGAAAESASTAVATAPVPLEYTV